MVKRKKVKSKNNRNALIFIICIIVILFCIILIVGLYDSKPYKEYTFDVEFLVNDTIGFDVNSSLLKFGRITPGSTATRTIIIDSNYDFPLFVTVLTSNNLKGLISSKDNLTVPANSNLSLDLTLSVPSDYKFGFYTGKVKINLRR